MICMVKLSHHHLLLHLLNSLYHPLVLSWRVPDFLVEAIAVLTSESQHLFSDQSSSDDGSDFNDTTYFSGVSSISNYDNMDNVLESRDPLYPDQQ